MNSNSSFSIAPGFSVALSTNWSISAKAATAGESQQNGLLLYSPSLFRNLIYFVLWLSNAQGDPYRFCWKALLAHRRTCVYNYIASTVQNGWAVYRARALPLPFLLPSLTHMDCAVGSPTFFSAGSGIYCVCSPIRVSCTAKLYRYKLKRKEPGHSSGAVWESRWTSWAVRPNEPSGFRGRKELFNRASALVTTCP